MNKSDQQEPLMIQVAQPIVITVALEPGAHFKRLVFAIMGSVTAAAITGIVTANPWLWTWLLQLLG